MTPAPHTLSDADCRVCGQGKPDFLIEIAGTDYFRCGRCQATLMAAANLPDLETEAQQYRLHRNDVEDPGYRRFVSQLAEPLAQRLAPQARGLDYGCGPGPVGAVLLREMGFRVAEYDPIFAPDSSLLRETYDFLFCSEVFEHFHHPAVELDRLDALLKPGGWLAIMTGFERPEQDFAKWHYRRDPTHVVFYRPATFECLADDRDWHAHFPAPNIALLQKSAVIRGPHP